MLNHIRNKVKKIRYRKIKFKKLNILKKVIKEQRLFKSYSHNGKMLMYKLLFTNGNSTRIYSKFECVLNDVKLSAKNYTNYYKIQYIPKCIISVGNILLKTF
jgi:roadblock/LC7 domain-containing protein